MNSESSRSITNKRESCLRDLCRLSSGAVKSVSYTELEETVAELEQLSERFLALQGESASESDTLSPLDAMERAVELKKVRLDLNRVSGAVSADEYSHGIKRIKLAFQYVMTRWPIDVGLTSLRSLL